MINPFPHSAYEFWAKFIGGAFSAMFGKEESKAHPAVSEAVNTAFMLKGAVSTALSGEIKLKEEQRVFGGFMERMHALESAKKPEEFMEALDAIANPKEGEIPTVVVENYKAFSVRVPTGIKGNYHECDPKATRESAKILMDYLNSIPEDKRNALIEEFKDKREIDLLQSEAKPIPENAGNGGRILLDNVGDAFNRMLGRVGLETPSAEKELKTPSAEDDPETLSAEDDPETLSAVQGAAKGLGLDIKASIEIANRWTFDACAENSGLSSSDINLICEEIEASIENGKGSFDIKDGKFKIEFAEDCTFPYEIVSGKIDVGQTTGKKYVMHTVVEDGKKRCCYYEYFGDKDAGKEVTFLLANGNPYSSQVAAVPYFEEHHDENGKKTYHAYAEKAGKLCRVSTIGKDKKFEEITEKEAEKIREGLKPTKTEVVYGQIDVGKTTRKKYVMHTVVEDGKKRCCYYEYFGDKDAGKEVTFLLANGNPYSPQVAAVPYFEEHHEEDGKKTYYSYAEEDGKLYRVTASGKRKIFDEITEKEAEKIREGLKPTKAKPVNVTTLTGSGQDISTVERGQTLANAGRLVTDEEKDVSIALGKTREV